MMFVRLCAVRCLIIWKRIDEMIRESDDVDNFFRSCAFILIFWKGEK